MMASLSTCLRKAGSFLPSTLRGFRDIAASPRPLAWFRIGLAAVLLPQALGLVGHLHHLYGRHGIVAWSVNSDLLPAGVPNVSWVDQALRFVGLPGTFGVPLTFAACVAGLMSLLLGYRTRVAAAVAWLSFSMLMISGEMSIYGVDRFAQAGLFYCLWFPVGHALSLDAAKKPGFLKKPGFWSGRPSFEAWLGLRVLQLHVCIAYLATGIEKSLGEQWWNGEAVWSAVMGTPDAPVDCSFLATVPGLSRLLCWTTLLLEAGVLLFVWHTRLRKLWLVGIVGLHLGIAVVLNLWSFSAVMIVFDVAAFGLPGRRNALTGGCEKTVSIHERGIRPSRWRLFDLTGRRSINAAGPAHS